MYESARLKGAKVISPFGPLTIDDLPSSKTKRWNIRRKAEVITAVRGGLLSLEEACTRYALNIEEFRAWEYCNDRYGLAGLRATRTQFYPRDGRFIAPKRRQGTGVRAPRHHGHVAKNGNEDYQDGEQPETDSNIGTLTVAGDYRRRSRSRARGGAAR